MLSHPACPLSLFLPPSLLCPPTRVSCHGRGRWGLRGCGARAGRAAASPGPRGPPFSPPALSRPSRSHFSLALCAERARQALPWQRWDAQQQVRGARHVPSTGQSGDPRGSRSAWAKVRLLPAPPPRPASRGELITVIAVRKLRPWRGAPGAGRGAGSGPGAERGGHQPVLQPAACPPASSLAAASKTAIKH